jgi:hypothetical protein
VSERDPFRDLGLATIAYGAIWGAFGQAAVRLHPRDSGAFGVGVAALVCGALLVAGGIVAWRRRSAHAAWIVGSPAALGVLVYVIGTWLTNRSLLLSRFSILFAAATAMIVGLAVTAGRLVDGAAPSAPYVPPGAEGPRLPAWKAPLMGAFYGAVFGLAGASQARDRRALAVFTAGGAGLGLLAGCVVALRDRWRR